MPERGKETTRKKTEMKSNEYQDPDFDLKESFLTLLPVGFTAQEVMIYLGLKKDKVVRWLKTDRNFNRQIMRLTGRNI